jgi:prepilin-type N-terminal cleavage/methylation domain-containing protein
MRRFLFFPAKAGFTLFELLVSISIIGLLIALATVSFSAAQSNARDARRRGDLTSMRNAFEQYYAANNAYPTTCAGTSTTNLANTLSAYLPGGVPTDPDPNAASVYTFACTATTYCACVDLEKVAGGNASNSSCAGSTGDYFCVENLQ